ncbi:farnesol dehydrogenase-like [Macrosteles quadrilineatus]|uniref:farnesol dehydrogenase-like n=1 Tax=Macrosteles quadrilineatus TaxID=74068 RepID=UPI0023E1A095|nr:farnesol dehydrogenase-like [Macrosteles quadrilineatus]XP_054266759.1 farnesol dehydrogenase-like [Macrosteles quadrilineatus]XP_054266760.1 farnesol dehydrogenase-like [Macrosteles quadrilineatus]XP_054266761.1 farnesol dehydrogenase-like [Macrosteles quadrilineatus]XP_054266762.1 farnesol dehydrogenase-like [Macrosteles quadrilineatus]
MERWQGRVAFVTGASAGIGEAIVEDLVGSGMVVVGVARREERLKDIKERLKEKPGTFHPIKCDITKEEDVKRTFTWVKESLGGVDVLVNNAGIFIRAQTCDGDVEEWRRMFDINVFALGSCSREALISMRERNIDDGHIININSVASHRIGDISGVGPYSSSKHASKCFTEGLRRELASQKSKIKVTSISPGVVDTEIFEANNAFPGGMDMSGRANLKSKDIADAVHYVLATPPHVQITELTIRPVGDGV